MTDAQTKKFVQVVGGICAAIGDGKPAPAFRGLALVLALMAETPEAVDNVAAAAKRVIEKRGES